jgi:hypothetical protein
VKLTAYVQGDTGVQRVKITNRDIAEVLLVDNPNARRGRLQWVSPQIFVEEPVQAVDAEGNPVFEADGVTPVWAIQRDEAGDPILDENGQEIPIVMLVPAVGSYLRIQTGRNEYTITDGALTRETIGSVENNVNANKKTVYSIDHFELVAGDSSASLQGFSTSKFRNQVRNGVDLSTTGSLKSKVNGTGTATGSTAVMEGTISTASPRVETEVIAEPPPEGV